MYTWVLTHKALAEKLLEHEHRQPELIQILKSTGETVLKDIDNFDHEIELKEIDPITFFCYIYKYGPEKRLNLLKQVALAFDIHPLPDNQSGIPSANAQKVWLFPWKKERNNNEIKRLWSFAKAALQNKISDELFADILTIRNTAPVKITEGLFYLDPEKYLPINSQTIPYLDGVLGINPNFKTWPEYLDVLKNVRLKTKEPFFKISHEAWLWNNEHTVTNGNDMAREFRYWIYAPGEKAKHWQEFFSNGIMAIGWDKLGDLNQYISQNDIAEKLREIEGSTGSKKNDAKTNFDFKETIKPGDIIIAKEGKRNYVGYGIVTSDYYYDDNRNYYRNCRDVKWVKSGSWFDPKGDIVLKTLTDITKYPDYVNRLKMLLEIDAQPGSNGKFFNLNKPMLNIILYGPPGTGKTYNTINKALEMLEVSLEAKSRDEIKAIFEEKIKQERIVFTTFHQSLSYEDFIEGIKPEADKEKEFISYSVQPGILKKICIDAAFSISLLIDSKETEKVLDFSLAYDNFTESLEEQLSSNESVTLETKTGGRIFVDSISQQGNIIIFHQEGTRKYTISKVRLSKLHQEIDNLDDVNNINDQFREIIGGSNSSAYWAVLNAIRKSFKTSGRSKEERTYTLEEKIQVVQKMKMDDYKNRNAPPYVLVIDEINRGNVSQIFGELITLIEQDKRAGMPEALEIILPYSREKFSVSPNLYIIGTMNTADRSVEALDTALRRRFSFQEMPPEPELIKTAGVLKETNGKIKDLDVVKLLETINNRLEKLIDKDHRIGHSYFMHISTEAELKQAFKDKVIPLLEEYFFGDFGKIGLVLGNSFVEKIKENTVFASFDDYGDSRQDLAERPVYRIKHHNEWDFSSIYQ
jgi:5-methylcytosine-specific restriction enzyme B